MIFALLTVIITVHGYVFYSLYVVNGRLLMEINGTNSVLGVCRATVFRKEPAAIVLFGALMWRYAMKRELEDIAAGIVAAEDSNEKDAVCITKMQPVTE